MKKSVLYVIIAALVLGFLVSVSILLYPTVGSYINSLRQSRAVAQHFDDVEDMDDTEIQAILENAREYNKTLFRKQNRYHFSDQDTAEYKKQLNSGRGVMGVVVIDKIDVRLPIYHGTSEGVLQIGAGHMPGSSLPVGGIGTHAVITGHRGVPSSRLLTDLDKIAEGDVFVLQIFKETLTYQVDQILTVEPEQMEALVIDPDMDCCTLVTCTPYGVNTHRLLVRGHRIENAADAGWEDIGSGTQRLNKTQMLLLLIVLALPALMTYLFFRCRKIRKGGKK